MRNNTGESYPYQFPVGTIIRTNSGLSDGTNGLWLVIGGTRNVMDMNSGYTMPALDANRWLSCHKVHGVRVKKLKPKVYEKLQLNSEVYDSILVDVPILPKNL